MKRAADRKTIVSRLIQGEPGSNPAIPIVWGISATIERFTTAMAEVTDRTDYPNVAVDIERVRAFGPHQGRDRSRPAGGEGDVLDNAAARGGQRHPLVSNSAGRRTRRRKVSPSAAGAGGAGAGQASNAKLTEIVGTIDAECPVSAAGDRARPGRTRAAVARRTHGRLGLSRVDPDGLGRARRVWPGGDLDRLGLPTR